MNKIIDAAALVRGGFDAVVAFVRNQFIPALKAIGKVVQERVAVIAPIVRQIVDAMLKKFRELYPTIRSIFSSIGEIIIAVMGIIQRVISLGTKAISKLWSLFGSSLLKYIGNLFGAIFKVISGVMKVVAGVVQLVLAVITGDWSGASKALKKIVSGLKDILIGLWHLIRDNVLSIVKALVSKLVDKLTELLHFVAGKLKAGLARVQDFILDPIRAARDKLNAIRDSITTKLAAFILYLAGSFRKGAARVQSFVLDPIRAARDKLKGILDAVAKKFGDGASAIGRAWSSVKDKAKEPIRFVVETVLENGILKAFRTVASKVGLDKLADSMHVALPKGFAEGGYTGPGTKYQPAGVVHADEHVWTKAEMSRFPGGHAAMEKWRYAVRSGHASDFPGYASGGRVVRPVPGGFGRFPSYPGHTGVDFPVGLGTPVHAVMAGVIKRVRELTTSYGKHVIQSLPGGFEGLYAHLSRIAVHAGQSVGAGDIIGYSGSTGNSTGPRLHFAEQRPGGHYVDPTALLNGAAPAPGGGGDSGGGFFDFVGSLKEKLAAPLKSLSKIKGSPLGEIAAKIPETLKDGLVDKVQSAVGNIAGSIASGVKGVAKSAAAGAWAPVLTTALGMNGLPLSLLDNWVRQVSSESGGNPNITQQIHDVNSGGNEARGLLQVIPPTFAAYRSKVLPNNIFNPLSNAYAAMNYAKHRYSNLEAVIGHGHGYATGTPGASKGLHWVGERGPELVNFRGGERVYTAQQSAEMAGGKGDTTLIVQGHVLNDELVQSIFRAADARDRRAAMKANFTNLAGSIPG